MKAEALRERWLEPDDAAELPWAPTMPCPNCSEPVDEEDPFLVVHGFESNRHNLFCASCLEQEANEAQPAPWSLQREVRGLHAERYWRAL